MSKFKNEFDFLDTNLAERYVRSYGTKAWQILNGVATRDDLGEDFGCSLFECEIRYLMNFEWAECADDIVWRRSKIGIRLDKDKVTVLNDWIASAVCSIENKKNVRSGNC